MKDLWFFLQCFKLYKVWLLTGTFLACITALASISLLTLSGWFITSAAVAGLLAPDGVAVTFNFMQPAAEIRALAMLRTFGRYTERITTHEATFRVLAGIRCWFFLKLTPLSLGQIAALRSADLLAAITQDIDALDAIYLRLLMPLMIALSCGGLVVVFLGYYSKMVALLVMVSLIVATLLIPLFFHHLGKKYAKQMMQQSVEFKIKQIEMLQGLADLLTFAAYPKYKKHIMAVSNNLLVMQTKNNRCFALSSAVSELLSQITLLIAIVMTAVLFQSGELSGSSLVMVAFCVLAVFEWVMPLSLSAQLLSKTQAAAKRVRQFSELSPAIAEPQNLCIIPEKGDVQLNNLSFSYPGQTTQVLDNISLTIPQGSKVAIIGDSGSGKTTLLQMLMRFYDPGQGTLEFADVNYQKIANHQLTERISLLSQKTQLFSTTIKENLLIAKPTASNVEIKQAINLSGLNDFIGKQPAGINAWVGDNGAKVSTGEARRIALARLYLRDTPIILLDEPTEGLDKGTEEFVLKALAAMSKDKTLVFVTHHTTVLRLADVVYRMAEGRLEKLAENYPL